MQIDLLGNIPLKSHKNLLGLGYMGSKQRLSTKILDNINNHLDGKIHDYKFYDLFAGGGSVSCQCLRNNIHVHYNELNSDIYHAFEYLLSDESLEPLNEFLNRDDYNKLLVKDNKTGLEVIRLLMHSFSFKFGEYFCSKEREPLHKRINDVLIADGVYTARKLGKELIGSSFRLIPKSIISRLITNRDMDYNLDLLTSSNLSYEDVEIDNGIIYCDIPYRGTGKYSSGDFNHDDFYQWALDNEHPVFISEYDMSDEFIEIAEFSHISSVCATETNKVTEKLYWNGVDV